MKKILIILLVLISFGCMSIDWRLMRAPTPPKNFPVLLIASDTVDDSYVEYATLSLTLWRDESKARDITAIERGTLPKREFDAEFYARYPVPTVWLLEEDNEEVIKLFKRNKYFEGLQYGNCLIITKNSRLSRSKFMSVFLHEYLHLTGLVHIKSEFEALMNEHVSSRSWITVNDVEVYCKIWKCGFE